MIWAQYCVPGYPHYWMTHHRPGAVCVGGCELFTPFQLRVYVFVGILQMSRLSQHPNFNHLCSLPFADIFPFTSIFCNFILHFFVYCKAFRWRFQKQHLKHSWSHSVVEEEMKFIPPTYLYLMQRSLYLQLNLNLTFLFNPFFLSPLARPHLFFLTYFNTFSPSLLSGLLLHLLSKWQYPPSQVLGGWFGRWQAQMSASGGQRSAQGCEKLSSVRTRTGKWDCGSGPSTTWVKQHHLI